MSLAAAAAQRKAGPPWYAWGMDTLFAIILPLLAGGLLSFVVRSAPFIDAQFKPWVTWLIAVGSVWVALTRSGVLHQLR